MSNICSRYDKIINTCYLGKHSVMFPSGELIPSADASGNRTHPQETLLNVNPDSMC